MTEELDNASHLLQVALERYLGACAAIQRSLTQGTQMTNAFESFSERMDRELPVVASYKTLLEQTQTSISWSRNGSVGAIPINKLPQELVLRIFHLVGGAQACINEGEGCEDIVFPEYPERLSHVCSRWRSIVLQSPTLWSHIDLAPCHSSHHIALLNRAVVHATRSGDLPLHLHLLSFGHQDQYDSGLRIELERFLASVVTRIKTLELAVGAISTDEDPSSSVQVFETCIETCMPGTLSQLVINRRKDPMFIQSGRLSSDTSNSPNSVILEASHEFLEALWQPVTVLRLTGLYPQWTSKAYHGLDELSLTGGGSDTPISEQDLMNIFQSSPALRSFQFNFAVTKSFPEGSSVTPVHLPQLEVIDLRDMSYGELQLVLRLIAPGSAPLKFSATGSYATPVLHRDIQAFLKRSNVTELRWDKLVGVHLWAAEFTQLIPSLQVLTLTKGRRGRGRPTQADLEVSVPQADERNFQAVHSRLKHLFLLRCNIGIADLRPYTERNPIPAITVWRCTFVHGDQVNLAPDVPEVQAELLHLSPVMNVVEDDKPGPFN